MKKTMIIIPLMAAVMLSGCVRTVVKINSDGSADAWRTAFLYPFEMGTFNYNPTNGAINVSGYKTDGGQDLASETAAKTAAYFLKSGVQIP